MPLLTVCLGLPGQPCSELVEAGRCPSCAAQRERSRRPSFRERYGAGHDRRRAEAIAAEPWCHNPAGCPHADAGTPANPLSLQHLIPRVEGGADGPVAVWCQRCNSADGGARSSR